MTLKAWLCYITGRRLDSVIDENNVVLLRELLSEKEYFSPNDIVPDYYNGLPLLHYAVERCRFACTAELLIAGAEVNSHSTKPYEGTPLHAAMVCEHFAVIPLLLYWGADSNIKAPYRQRGDDYLTKGKTFLLPIECLLWQRYFILSDKDCENAYLFMQKFQKTLPDLRQRQVNAKQAYQKAQRTMGDLACFNANLLKVALGQYANICERLYEVVDYEKKLLEAYQAYHARQCRFYSHSKIAQDYLSSCEEGLVYFAKEALPYYLVLLRHMRVFLEIIQDGDPDKVEIVRKDLITRVEKLCDHLSAEPNADCEEALRLLQQERDRVSGHMLAHQGSFTTVSDSGSDTSSQSLELRPLMGQQEVRHRSVGF